MSVSAEKAAPRVSERGRRVPASPIRKLASHADAARKRGVKVYHLNIGQPDLETPAPMRARLSEIHEKVYAYTPSNGTPECLDFLVGYYRGRGVELTRSQVITTTGGSEAIQFAFMACCETGDEALLVEPFYTNYRAFAAMGGIGLKPIVTRAEDGFHLPDREEWEKALTPKTKAVLLCNPNNPTGTVYSREELVRVAEFCRDHGLFLIADEVYREFVYDGRDVASALSLEGFEDVVVVVDSLSKRYSACGIRLGCLATRNRDVYTAALRMAQGRLSPPGLAQLVALGATELGPEYAQGVVREYQARREVKVGDREVRLTPIEFRLLVLLAGNAGKVLTHRQILLDVWGPPYVNESHYLRVFMATLRRKVEDDPARPRLLLTEPGVGYRMKES